MREIDAGSGERGEGRASDRERTADGKPGGGRVCDKPGSSWFHQMREHKHRGCGQQGGLGRALNTDVRNL